MSKLSKCTDMPVLLKDGAKLIGYVKNVYFDKIAKIFAYFYISADGKDLLLPAPEANVKDAIVLSDLIALIPSTEVDPSAYCHDLLGMAVYTLGGVYKGNVLDAQFARSGKLTKLTLTCGDVVPSSIACVGDVILLKPAKTSPPPRIPRPKQDYPVQILSPLPAPPDGSEEPLPAVSLGSAGPLFSQGAFNVVLDGGDSPSFDERDPHTPTRVICDYEFLLGRTLGADLRTYSGELLAPKGIEITGPIVELARAHGKLVELTLSSVKQRQ